MPARAFEVAGHGGRPLACVAYETGSDRAAVVLPGSASKSYRLGGTPARPDLNFTRALLVEHGYDVVEVWWDGDTRIDGDESWYRENAVAAVTAAGEDRVRVLVGRSLGTIALSLLPDLADLASIWIAPLNHLPEVRHALTSWRGPALVVAGDDDPAFEPIEGVETVIVPGGDHALNVGGAVGSARALADALERMDAWLGRLPE